MPPTRTSRVPSNSQPSSSSKSNNNNTSTATERPTGGVRISDIPVVNAHIPFVGRETTTSTNKFANYAEMTRTPTKPAEESRRAATATVMEKIAGATSSSNTRVPAYDHKLVDAATITKTHSRYNIAMTKLFSSGSNAIKPSFRAMVWPIYGTATNITDLSMPAIAHFLANSFQFRAQFHDEEDDDYAYLFRQHIVERASAEIRVWAPENFGTYVVDRIENEYERDVVRAWQLEVVKQLTKIMSEMAQDSSGVYDRVVYEQYIRAIGKRRTVWTNPLYK